MKSAFLAMLGVILLATIPVGALPSLDGEFTVDGDWPRPAAIEPGDRGPWVAELQVALNDSGFRAGEPDGEYGRATLAGVYAFQKVHDLERDGVFRLEYWRLFQQPLESPGDAPEDNRVEIDLGRQVLYLIEDNAVSLVLPVSSANGATYRHSSGGIVRAVTPEGSYEFYKQVDGWRISYLGGLYRPFYFTGGYALHGSGSVPPYPASHGCIRIEMWDMDYLAGEIELGMPVYVYGARNDRSSIVPTPPLTVDQIAGKRMTDALRELRPR
jgi:peptidoglycan hydrolase-like protein with peptidoglycan-binding domain